jgi:hypothetical protein
MEQSVGLHIFWETSQIGDKPIDQLVEEPIEPSLQNTKHKFMLESFDGRYHRPMLATSVMERDNQKLWDVLNAVVKRMCTDIQIVEKFVWQVDVERGHFLKHSISFGLILSKKTRIIIAYTKNICQSCGQGVLDLENHPPGHHLTSFNHH